MNYSPLRYPGGKSKITPLVNIIISNAGIKHGTYIEPFAGGAGVALSLLFTGKVNKIVINDYDRSIYSFWYSILNETERFIDKIINTPVTIQNWKDQKTVFLAKDNADIFELGFATFFLNRTNRSGILNAGPIGGFDQTGNYKIDARFNKEDLILRIKRIAHLKDKIIIYNYDVKEFINTVLMKYKNNSFIYFDPPYYVKGHELYTNFFTEEDHKIIADSIKSIDIAWMVTYDDVPQIKSLYSDREQKLYDLNYSLSNKGKKSEVIILSNNYWPSKSDVQKLKINLRKN